MANIWNRGENTDSLPKIAERPETGLHSQMNNVRLQ